jgi:hypothetical protein
MELPHLSSEEELIPLLERAFGITMHTQEDRAMKHEPGQSAGDMEEDDD